MLPTCRRLLFPCARGSRAIKEIGDANAIVCLSFFVVVCLFVCVLVPLSSLLAVFVQ